MSHYPYFSTGTAGTSAALARSHRKPANRAKGSKPTALCSEPCCLPSQASLPASHSLQHSTWPCGTQVPNQSAYNKKKHLNCYGFNKTKPFLSGDRVGLGFYSPLCYHDVDEVEGNVNRSNCEFLNRHLFQLHLTATFSSSTASKSEQTGVSNSCLEGSVFAPAFFLSLSPE